MSSIHKVGPYVIGNTLGAGVTGKVRLAFDKNSGLQVAVKIVRKDLLDDDSMAVKIKREIAVMKVMDHPNVLHLYDYYEDLDHMFLVLEYAPNGDLYDYLIKKGILGNEEALRVFQQLIEGLDYCHKRRIGHRDLKPENILLDAENNVKLCDFGMCALNVNDSLFTTSCGSPHYASPEVIESESYDGFIADIWSCGVILFAMVTGKLPFDDPNNDYVAVLEKVKKGKFTIPTGLHEDIQDLINKMLAKNPQKRITMEEIKNHAWFTSQPHEASTHTRIEMSTGLGIIDIHDNYVETIVDLGFGTVEEVRADLEDKKTESFIKAYYTILETRAKNKRPTTGKPIPTKLNRAKSEAMLPLSKVSKSLLRNSGVQKKEKSSGNSLGLASSLITPTVVRCKSEKDNTSDDITKPISISSRKSARFLSSFFSSSDAHIRKETKDGIISFKPLNEVTSEIEETLDSIGAAYSFSKKRDKIKAKLSKDSKVTKFYMYITATETNGHMISFGKRAGDKQLYSQVCSNIQSLLDV